MSAIGIDPQYVIGMDVTLQTSGQGSVPGVEYTMEKEKDVVRADQLIIKNVKTNKVFQISQEIGKVPVLSFGNSTGYHVISMRDDFKTIYGYGVQKVPFRYQ